VQSHDVRKLISDIREYENQADFARKTNERELPQLKHMASNKDNFQFTEEDKDLEKRMKVLAGQVDELEADSLSAETLDKLKKESSGILETLVIRYRERLEAHASRQGNI
jgi:restriction endonuclease Mrr